METDTLRQDSTKLDVTDLINPDILKDITNLINDNNSELTNSIYNPAEIKNISRYTSVVRQKVIENLFECIKNITLTSISEVTISTVSLGFTPDEIQKEIHIVTLINTLTIIAEPLDLNGFKADERFYIPLKQNDKIKIRLFKTVVSIERIDDNVDCEDYYHLTIPTQYKSYIKDFDLYKPTNDTNGNSIIILERDKRLQVRFTKEKYKFREIEIGKLLDRGVIVGPIKALEASNEIRIPLQFWFNRHIGLSLPIVAIENKVSIKIKLNKLKRQWYNKLFDDLGTSLIDSVEVNIDNICIDKHYGHWLETWFQLTIPNCKPHYTIYNDGNEIINGDIPNNFQRMSLSGGVITNNYMNFT